MSGWQASRSAMESIVHRFRTSTMDVVGALALDLGDSDDLQHYVCLMQRGQGLQLDFTLDNYAGIATTSR
jgi:hypothetical protein